MPPSNNPKDPFRDPRRTRIHRRLSLIGEGPAAFYRDACRILDGESGLPAGAVQEQGPPTDDLQGTPVRLVAAAHLVSHLFREIESAIRDVLLPTGAQIDNSHRHKSEIDAILGAYELDQDATLVRAWHRLTGQEEASLHRQAHRNNLARPRALDDSSRRYFSDIEAVFDAVLARFEERFTESLEVVDTLLAKHPPTDADLRMLRNRVPNNLITLSHFFSGATDPAWLDLLDGDGVFAKPPEPMPDEENETRAMQPWPAGQYLARMAAVPELQGRVAKIALAVPVTPNARVHEDLADVALALPVPLALQFVDRAKTWCRDPWVYRVSDKLRELTERFLGADEVDAALQLADALFDPANRPESDLQSGHEAWEYEQSLRKLAPSLVSVAGLRAVEVLTSCLMKLLQRAQGPGASESQDLSYTWRPAIEPHEQNPSRGSDARHALIDVVRDATEAICAAAPSQVAAVVKHLESAESSVLDRIALHLLRVANEVPAVLVKSHLLDPARLDKASSWHEYTLLARSRLGDLSRDEQTRIVRWEVERAVQLATEMGPDDKGDDKESETRERYARLSELRALERFRGVLPDEFLNRHKQLEQEFGRPEHPDLLSYHGALWVGPTSPKAAEEIRALSVDELLTYLQAWAPEPGPTRPSREGLARELENVVAAEPERFALASSLFRELHPSYLRGLIGGFEGAARGGIGFSWKPVLDLCAWAVEQGMSEPSRDDLADAPDAWAGSRGEVARLLGRGFQAGAQELPFEFRDQAWAVVERLSIDAEPTPEYEAEFVRANASAYDRAINTIRGTAMEAAIQYGLWVKRHLGRPSVRFDSMPELRSLLEIHLDPAIDPSLAVRSLYGRWLPWIHLLDPDWTATHLGQILPCQGAHEDLHRAAWDAYIVYCQPYNEVLSLLRDEYSRAVSELGPQDDRSERSPDEHLAVHLMVFYLRGQLDLKHDLLVGFFRQATEATRQHAMRFVGRVLFDNENLESSLISRAIALWESRTLDPDIAAVDRRLALAAFGWWFGAPSLDAAWRIGQLERVLTRNPMVEPDHVVFNQLLVLVLQYPVAVLACVRRMIEGAPDRWMTFSWRKELRQILEVALRSEDLHTERDARAIVGLLVARGETEYRTLLGSSS